MLTQTVTPDQQERAEELVRKIARLLIKDGWLPEEIDDQLMILAKQKMAEERLAVTKESLAKKFSQLVTRLIRRGLAEAAGMSESDFRSYFHQLRSAFVEHSLQIAPGEIGPILIIPENFVSLPKQATLTLIDNEKLSNNLDLTLLRNVIKIPTVPYLLIGASISPVNSVRRQLNIKRSNTLTAIEGTALLGQYPQAARKHLLLAGSDYDESNTTPNVAILHFPNQRPFIDYLRQNVKYDKLHLATCRDRIIG